MTDRVGNVVYPGRATGPILCLQAPISLWGGVDPETGEIVDPRHPDRGALVGGCVLVLPGAIGSSSSSAIMLELLRNGTAPAALVLVGVDAILALGVIVARELGYPTIPILEISRRDFESLPPRGSAAITEGGSMRILT